MRREIILLAIPVVLVVIWGFSEAPYTIPDFPEAQGQHNDVVTLAHSNDQHRTQLETNDQASGSSSSPPSWLEDSEKVDAFLKSYYRNLPKAIKDIDELRSVYRQKTQEELVHLLDRMSTTLVFNRSYPGDYEGFTYDTMAHAESCVRLQVNRYISWENSGSKIEELPYLHDMIHKPMYYPPSFIIYKIRGTKDVEFSAREIEHISNLRNAFVREIVFCDAEKFEKETAASLALKETGLPRVQQAAFRSIIPEWQENYERRQSSIQTYYGDVRLFAENL